MATVDINEIVDIADLAEVTTPQDTDLIVIYRSGAAPQTVTFGALRNQIQSDYRPLTTATATEAIAALSMCNLSSVDGVATIVPANATDLTKPANCILIQAATESAPALVYMAGQWITGFTGLTPGAQYWLSTTDGQISTSPPASGAGHGSQVVGMADVTGTQLFFNPQPMFGI